MAAEPVHFVRHMLDGTGGVRTEYRCTAAVGSPCRVACKVCWDASEERCMCDYCDREPQEEDTGVCNTITWLSEGAPDECYDGVDQPVRGPDWQPIKTNWEGEYYTWDYLTPPVDKA